MTIDDAAAADDDDNDFSLDPLSVLLAKLDAKCLYSLLLPLCVLLDRV